jgi:hypothetical protein
VHGPGTDERESEGEGGGGEWRVESGNANDNDNEVGVGVDVELNCELAVESWRERSVSGRTDATSRRRMVEHKATILEGGCLRHNDRRWTIGSETRQRRPLSNEASPICSCRYENTRTDNFTGSLQPSV